MANATGWIFTEMGRQPWVVYGLLKTARGVSPVGTGYVVTTLVGFTAIYSLLAIIDFGLMARYARFDAEVADEHGEHGRRPAPGGRRRRRRPRGADDERAPALIY